MLTGERGSGQVNVTAMALAPSAAGESFPPFLVQKLPIPICSVIILKIHYLTDGSRAGSRSKLKSSKGSVAGGGGSPLIYAFLYQKNKTSGA